VLAVDGSKYLLPDTPEVNARYGTTSNQYERNIPMALGSSLYDVFQGIVLDSRMSPWKTSERDLAYQHLQYSETNDLTLYDRGYPAFWMFSAHQDKGSFFCMRVRSDFNKETTAFTRSKKKQDFVVLKASEQMKVTCREKGVSTNDISVRLLRIKTRKGDYILITNLLNKRNYPLKSFKELYHLRWQVEESYKQQKSWLEIENFTGKSVLAIQQDYYASVLNQTLAGITAYAAESTMSASIQDRKLRYAINKAFTLSALKNTVIHLLFDTLDESLIYHWLESIGKTLSAIRPGRSFTRKKKVTDRHKFHMCYKRSL